MSLFGDLPAPKADAATAGKAGNASNAGSSASAAGASGAATDVGLASVGSRITPPAVRRIPPTAPVKRLAPPKNIPGRGRKPASAGTATRQHVDPDVPDVPMRRTTGREYDPMNPNEYEVLVEQREEQRRMDLRAIAGRPPAIQETRQRATPNRSQTGEQAFLQRATMVRPQTAPATLSGRQVVDGPNFTVGPKRGGPNKVSKMMERMGWEKGRGLGKQQQGIVEPVGVTLPQPDEDESAPTRNEDAPARQIVSRNPPPKRAKARSRVVFLRNMVAAHEVDDDLEQETEEECAKYGRVQQCVIHVPSQSSDDVSIFVEFAEPEAAARALVDLDGRFFGGRIVRASLFPEARFQSRQYALPDPLDD